MPPLIVVAEDQPYILEILAAVLEDEGYRILRADDGAMALAMIEREHPDLLLTDNMMPRLSGMALIAELQDRPEPPLPVILMSAITPALAPPRNVTFLPKPFDLTRLLEMVADQVRAG